MEWITLASSFVGLILGLFAVSRIITSNTEKIIKEGLEKNEKGLIKKFQVLENKINDITHLIETNERDRLSCELSRFTSLLRTGYEASTNDYKQFYKNYQQYKDLGGNSFIEQEKLFVDDIYKNHNGKKRKKEVLSID